jgi:hypothetical protein
MRWTSVSRQRKPQECEINPDMQLRFKYPNIWINIIAKKIKVFVYFAPIDDEQVILYLRFYNCITPFKLINRLIGFFGKYANLMIERQDKRVVNTQRPKRTQLRMGEKLIQGDQPIVVYRKIERRADCGFKGESIMEFIAIIADHPVRMILSNPLGDYRKSEIRLIEGQPDFYQCARFTEKQVFHVNFATVEKLHEFLMKEFSHYPSNRCLGSSVHLEFEADEKG